MIWNNFNGVDRIQTVDVPSLKSNKDMISSLSQRIQVYMYVYIYTTLFIEFRKSLWILLYLIRLDAGRPLDSKWQTG